MRLPYPSSAPSWSPCCIRIFRVVCADIYGLILFFFVFTTQDGSLLITASTDSKYEEGHLSWKTIGETTYYFIEK